MYAHVTTYRLGTSSETDADIQHSLDTGDPISDQTARTIASFWHASSGCPNITALSHGRPFDTEELREEVIRDVTDSDQCDVLFEWIEAVEAILSE